MAPPLKPPSWFKEARSVPCTPGGAGTGPAGFIERNLGSIASIVTRLVDSEETAERDGFLQGLDARARLAGIFILVLAAAVTENTFLLAGIMIFTAVVARLSSIPLKALLKRVLPAFIFTSIVVIPVFFSLRGAGRPVFSIGGLSLSRQGLGTGVFLIARVASMAASTSLLLLSTRQTDFFSGLRRLPVPSFFVTALFMTFRHILILLKIAEDATLARKSRTISRAALRESQRWFGSRIALFLRRSLSMAEEVNMAIQSRGFSGKIKTLDGSLLKGNDYLWLGMVTFALFLSLGL